MLDLAANQLTGAIPSELGNLSNLRQILLNENKLTGPIPESFGNLSDLRVIWFRVNQLDGELPSALGDLQKLQYLVLSNNEFSGELPPELGGLSSLRFLRLDENNLTGNIPSELGNLSNLRDIWLNDNQLSGPIPEGWGNLENLKNFVIEHNFFSSLPELKDVTGNLWLDELKLTFDDIIPNLDVSAHTISYSPQKPFGEPQTVKAATGSTVELTPETSHPGNEYQWHKDGQAISGATSKVLTLSDVTESDFGEYHVEVTNSNATDLTIQSEPFTLESYHREFETTYSSGWNLVSLPFEPSDGAITTSFPDADKAFTYSGGYDEAATLEPKQGYWLKFDGESSAAFQGEVAAGVDIDLSEGWNLIGTAADSAYYADIDDPDGILMDGTLQGYNGAYQVADALAPGRGYFVRASSAGTITLNVKEAVKGKSSPKYAPVEQFDEIIVSNGSAEQSLYINGRLVKDWERANFLIPPVPPDPVLDTRIDGSYRLSEADSVSFDLASRSFPVTIRLSSENSSQSYYVSGITDGKPGEYRNLGPGQEIKIAQPYDKVAIFSEKHMKNRLPDSFDLKQNYPNPFNPTTQIEYQLPEQSNVQLEVFNVLGRKVATLVDTQQQPGTHSVQFNASALSSGMYFVRLKAGTFRKIQKITLIK